MKNKKNWTELNHPTTYKDCSISFTLFIVNIVIIDASLALVDNVSKSQVGRVFF